MNSQCWLSKLFHMSWLWLNEIFETRLFRWQKIWNVFKWTTKDFMNWIIETNKTVRWLIPWRHSSNLKTTKFKRYKAELSSNFYIFLHRICVGWVIIGYNFPHESLERGFFDFSNFTDDFIFETVSLDLLWFDKVISYTVLSVSIFLIKTTLKDAYYTVLPLPIDLNASLLID